MKVKEPVVYAVLLVFALGFAYQTWTRDESANAASGDVVLWEESTDAFVSADYHAADRSVHVERRGTDDDAYLWGRVIRTRPTYRPIEGDSMVRVETVDTIEFVVGPNGDDLVEALATPRALRDLGAPDSALREAYGLADSTAQIAIRFRDGERSLTIGGSAYSSNDRYALDPATGRGYVLPSETVALLEDADSRLPERRLHDFDRRDLVEVVVTAGGGERTLRRADGAGPGEEVWTAPDAPDRPDQTFANFMLRLRRLSVNEYLPDADLSTLEPTLRIEYFGPDREPLGFFELFHRPGVEGEAAYVFRTELTRVAVTTYGNMAEEVASDAAQLF
ncbi:MAG TPA: hypothetical protein VF188_04050 [Longimicrobiales bacterium]